MAVFQDLSGRAAGPRALRLRGAVVALVVVLTGFLAAQYYSGAFTPSLRIQLTASRVGEGLAVGADVKYRGLIIGKVESIETRGTNEQRIWLSLNPEQADGMRGIVSAKYQASNIFGAPAIELLSGNGDNRLRDGDAVQIDSSGKVASTTNSLRQIASLTTLLGTDKVQRLLRLVTQNGDILAGVLQAGFSLGRLYADNLRKPVVGLIQEAIPIMDGFQLVLSPAIRELEAFYDSAEFLADPAQRNATIEALSSQTLVVFDEVANILDHSKSNIVDSFGFLIDIGHPLLMSAGSAASAWGNLETFLNRAEEAMPMIDGKVKLRLEVLLPASRALPEDGGPAGSEEQSEAMRQLTPEQQRQVQKLQTQILGFVPQSAPAPQQGQAQAPAPQQSAGGDFATIPNQGVAGGPR